MAHWMMWTMMLLLSKVTGLLWTNLDRQTVEVRGHSRIRPLQICEPANSPGGQSEQVVHGVGMIPQTILLLQQLEGWHAQSLKEEGGGLHHHHHQTHTGMKILL